MSCCHLLRKKSLWKMHCSVMTEFKRNNNKKVFNRTETLGPRIGEIVPDYIKKATALRNLN